MYAAVRQVPLNLAIQLSSMHAGKTGTTWNRRADEKDLFRRQGLYNGLLFDQDNEQQGYNDQDVDQYPYMDMNVGEYGYADDLEENVSEEELKEIGLGEVQAYAVSQSNSRSRVLHMSTSHTFIKKQARPPQSQAPPPPPLVGRKGPISQR